jgi:hypothetical protein
VTSAGYYANYYHIVVGAIILIISTPLLIYSGREQYKQSLSKYYTYLVLAIVTAFIGLRDPYATYFVDTIRYSQQYNNMQGMDNSVFLKDPGFFLYMWLASKILMLEIFYLLTAFLYVFLPYLAFKKWFGYYSLFALLMYIGSMSFWTYGVNGVRNGLATSILIYAFSKHNRKMLMLMIMLISISIHKSLILPIMAFFIATRITNTKVLIVIWLFIAVIMAVTGNELGAWLNNLMEIINYDERSHVLITDKYDHIVKGGYRFDFLLYSSAAIFLGYYYLKKGVKDVFYIRLLNTYIIANIVWVIFIYAAYSNRIAYLSWFLMPIIMLYPLLTQSIFQNKNKLIAYLILINFIFSAFLFFKQG